MTNTVAAVVNIFFPGFGQLIQGRVMSAILWWILLVPLALLTAFTGIFIVLLFPAYVWCIVDSVRYRG